VTEQEERDLEQLTDNNVLSDDANKELLDKLRAQCKKSPFFLGRVILGYTDFTKDIHLPFLQRLSDFEHNNRIVLVMPRTWFKSTIIIVYAIWRAINTPNVRILICQNSYGNAVKKLNSIKQIFEKNVLFRALFPDILPTAQSVWRTDCLTVNRTSTDPEGTFEAAGVGTAVISRHYDVIIEDDTVSPEKDEMGAELQVPTALEIAKSIGWHNLATPLLIHPLKSQIVVVGTRWAEEDLIGHIINTFKNYVVLTRSVREKDGKPANKDEGGVPAWPERFSEEVLEELERALGPFMFATLMMNSPTSSSDRVFRREWMTYYDSVDTTDLVCITSVDPASADPKKSADPDYTVVLTTGIRPSTGEIFVLCYDRRRMNPGEQVDTVFSHYILFRPVIVLIEAVSYQRTLKYWVEQKQKALNVLFLIEEFKGGAASKIDRINGLQPFYNARRVKHKPEMDTLERELLAHPTASGHDDVADALSMQISKWNDIILTYVKSVNKELIEDPLSGKSILAQLRQRSTTTKTYPYDIGNMKDRVNERRQYVYN